MLRGGLVAALLSGASGLALTHRLAAGRQSPRPIVCMAADAGGEAVAEKEEPAGPSPAELFGESSDGFKPLLRGDNLAISFGV